MIKTIKVKKKMNFRELMVWISENDIKDMDFKSDEGDCFYINKNRVFIFQDAVYGDIETYEVEVEEEITEDTEFELVLINTASHLTMRHDYSIKHAKHTFNNIQEIFARIDGRVQKIWEKDGKI